MHKNGWRPFWAALGAALLVLLPLVGGTVLLTRQMVRTRIQTAQPQSGVPIQLPRAEHRMTLLLCTAGEQPGFLLVYLNAAQNSLNLLAVPGELTVPFNGETSSLAHCYGAAGPARCRQALLEVLGEAETRAKKLAESDEYGFIAAADANAENVVHSLYDNIVDGRKVVVEFK